MPGVDGGGAFYSAGTRSNIDFENAYTYEPIGTERALHVPLLLFLGCVIQEPMALIPHQDATEQNKEQSTD